jgi:DNA invertase Pin-like site-specific DNA recombinase
MTGEAITQAVLYAAKSSPDEKGSIPDQLRITREGAEREGRTVVNDHEDENASAWSGNRGPGLEAALAEAEDLGAELWVLHSDRLCRGDGVQARHLVQLVLECKAAGIRLRSVEDDSSLDNVLMAAAMGERNTEDSRRKSAAVKDGHRRSRARGKIGGSRSLGYELRRLSLDSDEREPVVVRAEAVVVQRIYDEFLAGRAQLGISRDLARDNVPTATGGEWHPSTVRRILMNPVYTGLVRLGGRKGTEFAEAGHERIIDRGKWWEVQALIAAKATTHRRGRQPTGSHLFRRGHLRCECGGAMVPRTEKGERECYRCYSRFRDPTACSMPPISREVIDSAVYAYFAQVGLDVEATREQLREARDHKLAEVSALLATAEREAAEVGAAVDRIEHDYSRGKLDVDDWKRLRARLEPELEAANAERDRLREQFAQVERDADVLATEAEVVEELARVRNAIAGEITDAEGIEAVRAVLLRQFDTFVLRREGLRIPTTDGTDVYLDAETPDGEERWIEPVPSEHAIKGFDESYRPVLHREPLVKAGNKCAPVRTGS